MKKCLEAIKTDILWLIMTVDDEGIVKLRIENIVVSVFLLLFCCRKERERHIQIESVSLPFPL